MARTYRLGVIGFAHMHVNTLMRTFADMPNVEWIACADTVPEVPELIEVRSCRAANLRYAHESIGIPKVYADYREMLAKEKLDFVIFCPENARHGEVGEAIAATGANMLTEKPMSASLADALRLARATERYGVELFVNWPITWSTAVRKAKELVDHGAIGDVWQVKWRGGSMGPFSHGSKVVFPDGTEREMTGVEKGATWWYRAGTGGGAMLDYCCYGACLSRLFVGTPATSVTGMAANLNSHYGSAEDNAVFTVRFPKALAVLEATWSCVDHGAPLRPVHLRDHGHDRRRTVRGRAGGESVSRTRPRARDLRGRRVSCRTSDARSGRPQPPGDRRARSRDARGGLQPAGDGDPRRGYPVGGEREAGAGERLHLVRLIHLVSDRGSGALGVGRPRLHGVSGTWRHIYADEGVTGMAKPRIAVVGCGTIANVMHLPTIKALEVAGRAQLVAVCDISPEAARGAAEAFGACGWYTDLDRMLSEREFDLLVNATRIPDHFAVTMAALRAGRHVYTQKPMTTTVREATTLIAEAKQRGLTLACHPDHPVRPAIRKMAELVRDGAIGKVAFAKVNSSHFGPETHDVPRDSTWFYKPGSNPILDMGVHGLSMITAVLGPVKRLASFSGRTADVRVHTAGAFKGKEIGVEIDDNSLLMLDFGDATFAFLDSTYCVAASLGPRIEVYGSKGVLALTGAEAGMRLQRFVRLLDSGKTWRSSPVFRIGTSAHHTRSTTWRRARRWC